MSPTFLVQMDVLVSQYLLRDPTLDSMMFSTPNARSLLFLDMEFRSISGDRLFLSVALSSEYTVAGGNQLSALKLQVWRAHGYISGAMMPMGSHLCA
jgi:hypothetical protein